MVASCAIDEMWDGMEPQEDGEEVVMTFKPKFEDFESATKAIGYGSKVNQYIVDVYEVGKQGFTRFEFDKVNKIELPFIQNREYEVYFWAQHEDNNVYDLSKGLKNVKVNYSSYTGGDNYGTEKNIEDLDAFFAVKKVKVTSRQQKQNGGTITLTRPFAQINLAIDAANINLDEVESTEITIKNAADTFNPVLNADGTFSPSATKTTQGDTDVTFKFNSFPDGNGQLETNDKSYIYVGTAYLFVDNTRSVKVSVKITLKDGTVIEGSDLSIEVSENIRTNIIFNKPSAPEWVAEEVKLPEASADDWIHIKKPEQLAALLINEDGKANGTVESPKKYHVCGQLNMKGMPDNLAIGQVAFNNVIIDGGIYADAEEIDGTPTGGGSYMINKFTAPSFFGTATNLTVRNLNLDEFKVESQSGHVGTLVNTLKGSSTFTNITVSNSSATTSNGAAGGVVGYIVRNTPTSRSESVSVSFDNCDLSAVTATGSLTDGKFVGRLSGYDNGEVVTFTTTCSAEGGNSSSMSKYLSSNLACWLTDAERSAFNGWIGDEVYYRGKVSYGDTRVAVKWDGTTTVEPLLANATYDASTTAGTKKFVVYSAFDLAGVRKKTESPAAIYLKADVDMNGQGADGKFNVPSNFTQSAYSSTDDKVFDPFNYVTTLDGSRDASTNNSIYNLSIAQIEQEKAAFVLYASGTTVHKNINFRNCQTVAVHKPVDTDAKAYGAILVANVDATYTMENVHAYDCKVFALQKVGTLGARISGTSTLKNNSVNNCYVENYECTISERFESGPKTMAGITIKNVYADFYPHGEVGGMYGFIQGSSTLTGCKVNGTTINAFGQDDKDAKIQGSGLLGYLAAGALQGLGYYLVPGRHVSTLIGNIRATGTVTLTGCSVDANTQCTKRHDKHNSTYHYIGQAYIVKFLDSEGSVTVDGNKLTLADCNRNTKR